MKFVGKILMLDRCLDMNWICIWYVYVNMNMYYDQLTSIYAKH
ncbi:hypothetical protein Goarm_010893 [Gossypium armourianum]|uniref:Uncharacterized protein n=1 Tax=Gossypium armourianum TaxID=34283 RepID=A0A7J9IXT2_9ROSI|nr:hypothetical protein [Gossypium armourianum]